MVLILGMVCSLAAQTNPFDLVPRLPTEARRALEEAEPHPTGNPFDVVPPSSLAQQKPFLIVEPQEEKVGLPNRYRRFVFTITIFSLISLTFIITLLRGLLSRVYRGVLNENILSQTFRDRDSVGPFPYWILYGLFFLNAGFFVFLLAHHFDRMPWSGVPYYTQLFRCIGLVTGLLLLKHLVLHIVAYVFPVEKEMSLYNFMLETFNIVLGIALVPINLMVAYAPEAYGRTVVIILLLAIGLFYLFRYLRGSMIANNYLVFHKFHFLLYICTVEIAPVMVLLKLITG